MVSLLLTILFSTLIIVLFRLFGQYKVNGFQSITFNYLFAAAFGLLFWKEPLQITLFTEAVWFEIALFTGLLFVVTFLLLSGSSRSAGVSITAVASRMSVVIPVLAGFVIFGEPVTLSKIVGIVLVVISFYLIFKRGSFSVTGLKRVLLPLLLFIGIGANDTVMKYVQLHYLSGNITLFLTVVFLVAFISCLLIMLFHIVVQGKKLSLITIPAGLVLGALNFGSTYYFIQSMSYFEPSLFFPLVNAGIVLTTTLTGILFFREKLYPANWIGIILAVGAIIIMTVT